MGNTITGGTSGAVGTVYAVTDFGAGLGELVLMDLTGNFDDNEAIANGLGDTAVADGTEEAVVPGMTFPGGLTSADMNFVFVFKNRLFFVQKGSMNAWYNVDVDAIGGTYDVFAFGGLFALGGSLLFGSPWSMESSGDGGLSEQCVFVSTEGEVVTFQGSDPGSAAEWTKVGTYRIGRPLGKRGFMRGGGDIAIATTVGLVPLSKAISLDVTALNVATVSYKIADAWSEALAQRGDVDWICHIWPEGKMAVVSPPDPVGLGRPVLFISNTETGAWCRFTGWDVRCVENFRGQMYFGSSDGRIFIANAGGTDDGEVYSGAVAPLHVDLDAPASRKVATVGRARGRATSRVNGRISLLVDFSTVLPAAPDATSPGSSSTWGTAVWGQSVWSDFTASTINQDWQSVGGMGYSLTLCYQVSSGAVAPLDVDLIDLELLYTVAEMANVARAPRAIK